MNVLHNCSVLGVTCEDGVALVKFSFLTQMTLTEHHGMQATLLSAFYVGSWEASNIAWVMESSLMPRSFRKLLVLWTLLLTGDWWRMSSQERALRTLSKFMNQDYKTWNIENSRIKSSIMFCFHCEGWGCWCAKLGFDGSLACVSESTGKHL